MNFFPEDISEIDVTEINSSTKFSILQESVQSSLEIDWETFKVMRDKERKCFLEIR